MELFGNTAKLKYAHYKVVAGLICLDISICFQVLLIFGNLPTPKCSLWILLFKIYGLAISLENMEPYW